MAIKITEIKNAISINDDNTEFDVEINHPEFGWIPYGLRSYDTDTTINNDELLVLIGKNFTVKPQKEKDDEEASLVRAIREGLFRSEVDPVITNPLRWSELTTEQQDAWKQYRTDLLNISEQSGFPYSVTFPTKPS